MQPRWHVRFAGANLEVQSETCFNKGSANSFTPDFGRRQAEFYLAFRLLMAHGLLVWHENYVPNQLLQMLRTSSS